MNDALAILWTLVIIGIILLIAVIIWSTNKYFTVDIKTVSVNIYDQCTPPFSTLVNASTSKICVDGNRYVPTLGMIVSSNQTPYMNACLTACVSGVEDQQCINPQENEIFERCVQLSQPLECSSLSNPVAYIGSNYYYVSSIGSC